jgi:hypothetical protein
MEFEENSDNKIMAGENATYLIHENIIYVVAIGEQTEESALYQKEVTKIFTSRLTGQVNYLINLNKCGKNSIEARHVWKGISEEDRTDRVALFGMNPVAKVLASFFMGIVGRKNQRFFSNKEDALEWLQYSEGIRKTDKSLIQNAP